MPRGRFSSAYQFVDNLTFSAGAHTYKFGGEYRRAIVNSFNDVNARGRLNFNNLADFLAGRDFGFGHDNLARRDAARHLHRQLRPLRAGRLEDHTAPDAQFGLRYEYLGVFKEESDRLANFVPGSPTGLVQVGTPGLSDLYDPDRNNFAPRFGFAYDLTGKGQDSCSRRLRFLLRHAVAGFLPVAGLPERRAGQSGDQSAAGPGRLQRHSARVDDSLRAGRSDLRQRHGAANFATFALFAVDLNLRTPYIQNYNLNVQQEVRPGMVLQVGYVGSHGTKLFRVRDINQATPGLGGDAPIAAAFQRAVPAVFVHQLSGDFGQLQLQRLSDDAQAAALARAEFCPSPIPGRSQLTTRRTASIGGTRGVSFPQDSFNLRAERAVSVFDQRQRFSANFTYDLEFLTSALGSLPKALTEGWQLSGIYTGASGLPITPFMGSMDVSGTGELNDRPNLIGDPDSGAQRDAALWFNTAAFALRRPERSAPPGATRSSGQNCTSWTFPWAK